MMKGPKIWSAITSVRYIRGSLYRDSTLHYFKKPPGHLGGPA